MGNLRGPGLDCNSNQNHSAVPTPKTQPIRLLECKNSRLKLASGQVLATPGTPKQVFFSQTYSEAERTFRNLQLPDGLIPSLLAHQLPRNPNATLAQPNLLTGYRGTCLKSRHVPMGSVFWISPGHSPATTEGTWAVSWQTADATACTYMKHLPKMMNHRRVGRGEVGSLLLVEPVGVHLQRPTKSIVVWNFLLRPPMSELCPFLSANPALN